VVGINVRNFLTALVTFELTAVLLNVAVEAPYNRLSALGTNDQPEQSASAEELLTEIRDLLIGQT